MPKHEPSPRNHLRGNPREERINTGNAAGKCFLDRLGVAAPTSRVLCGENTGWRARYLSGPSNRVWRCQRNGIAVERFDTKDLLPPCRIKKTLIARCMIGKSRQTRISRFEGAYYAQYRFSCRSSRSHLFLASTGDSRERSNRRWCRRRTYRRGIARWGPGVTPCSTAAGLLCAAAVYVEEPVCRFVRERYWDGYGWVYRRVEVCD